MRAPIVFARTHSLVGCSKAFQRRWQHTKPFYVTTPIFYPNAGKLTSFQAVCSTFSSFNAHNLQKPLTLDIYTRRLLLTV